MRMFCVFLGVSVGLCIAATKGTPEDETAIRQVLADWTASFNRHEANLNADAFSDDFDVVNPPGAYISGKPDLREAFNTFLKNARRIDTVDRIRFIRPDVAVVDGAFELTGTDWKPYPKGLQTVVLVKDNGRWLVTALRSMLPIAAAGVTPPKR